MLFFKRLRVSIARVMMRWRKRRARKLVARYGLVLAHGMALQSAFVRASKITAQPDPMSTRARKQNPQRSGVRQRISANAQLIARDVLAAVQAANDE